MSLTQEAVLTFLSESGGQVKNSDLLNFFRGQINCADPAERQHNRDLFKKFVNGVAFVKQVEDVKFVVLKKKYQDFGQSGEHAVGLNFKSKLEGSSGGLNTSFPPTSTTRHGASHHGQSGKMLYSDLQNNNHNNTYRSQKVNGSHLIDGVKSNDSCNLQRQRSLPCSLDDTDTATVKVLSISSDHGYRMRKAGSVFAVVAVKSPPHSPSHSALWKTDGFHAEGPQGKPPGTPEMLPLGSPQAVRLDLSPPGVSEQDKDVQNDKVQDPGSPHPTRTQNKTTRQGEDAKFSESVPLEPVAHEWLVKSAGGLWGQIYALLLKDPQLAKTRDFMSGFTALHWAAKRGNSEMVHNIMEISKRRGTSVNVNSKTHGGYTPLHIAAIHGHKEVMALLVKRYSAKVNVRDNDGKKPHHYLGKGVSADLRELLGGLAQDKCRNTTENEEFRELPKHNTGLNTISKLFQPHIGHRKKQRQQSNF